MIDYYALKADELHWMRQFGECQTSSPHLPLTARCAQLCEAVRPVDVNSASASASSARTAAGTEHCVLYTPATLLGMARIAHSVAL